MGVSDAFQHRWGAAAGEAMLALCTGALGLGLASARFDAWRRRATVTVLLVVFTFYAYDQPERVAHLVWLPLFPVAAVLVAGRFEATIATAVMVAGQALVYLGYRSAHGRWSIPPEELVESLLLAETDPLTGVANRRRFYEALAAESARAERYGSTWSVLSIDLDHFKTVNDTHGHEAGDAVLRSTAMDLGALIRQGDILARVGGEEFAILTPETTGSSAAALADRLRVMIASRSYPALGTVTCSLGVAQALPGEEVDRVLRRADSALYQAKASGRNRVVMAEGPRSWPTAAAA
jgi:diguanylate cyclase (GGDEF)-like protein